MGSYQDLKKLDEESLQQLREGSGPSDKCICNLLAPDKKKSFGTSLKKALGIIGKSGGKNREPPNQQTRNHENQRSIMVPLHNLGKGAKGLQSTKQVVKRKSSCGKCGCDDNQMVLKHSYANIRITSPDISSICPCPTDCLPDKEKLRNNIKVIVERTQIQPQSTFRAQSDQSVTKPSQDLRHTGSESYTETDNQLDNTEAVYTPSELP